MCAWTGAFLCAFSFRSGYTFTKELYPTPLRATALGTASASARLGSILSPMVAMTSTLHQVIYQIFQPPIAERNAVRNAGPPPAAVRGLAVLLRAGVGVAVAGDGGDGPADAHGGGVREGGRRRERVDRGPGLPEEEELISQR